MSQHIDIVFDGPPGPEAGRFVEVEDHAGRSICFGNWLQREDGYWVLRLPQDDKAKALNAALSYVERHDRIGLEALDTAASIRAALAGVGGSENTLNTAWGNIAAIGGSVSEYDDFGKGINHAVEQALFIIEELGGQDPLKPRGADTEQAR